MSITTLQTLDHPCAVVARYIISHIFIKYIISDDSMPTPLLLPLLASPEEEEENSQHHVKQGVTWLKLLSRFTDITPEIKLAHIGNRVSPVLPILDNPGCSTSP
jgi:hypothetical protein